MTESSKPGLSTRTIHGHGFKDAQPAYPGRARASAKRVGSAHRRSHRPPPQGQPGLSTFPACPSFRDMRWSKTKCTDSGAC